jgi:hypothetical protein
MADPVPGLEKMEDNDEKKGELYGFNHDIPGVETQKPDRGREQRNDQFGKKNPEAC